MVEDAIHVGADGKRYLVIHGDLFDVVIRHARWLALLGNHAYDLAIWLNTYFNAIRRGARADLLVAVAMGQAEGQERRQLHRRVRATRSRPRPRRRGVDGVICGHIHHAVIRDKLGLAYINCGDWVESCTAVVEHFDGAFEIVKWEANRPVVAEPDYRWSHLLSAGADAAGGARPQCRADRCGSRREAPLRSSPRKRGPRTASAERVTWVPACSGNERDDSNPDGELGIIRRPRPQRDSLADAQRQDREEQRQHEIEHAEDQQRGQQLLLLELRQPDQHRGVEHAEAARRVAEESEQRRR